MEFVKKHYEKIILSLVLLGMAAVVVFMLFRIRQERAYLEEKEVNIVKKKNPYKALPTADYDVALERARRFNPIVLSGPHNTFNPVMWQRKPDGTLLKIVTGKEIGPAAARLMAITPLYYTLEIERISGSSYQMSVIREAAENVYERMKRLRYVSMTSPKTEFFLLKDIKGEPQNPTELVFELTDPKETVSVAPDKPYKRIDGYTADLRYDLENRDFTGVRNGETIAFAGDEYVVEISADQVVLSAKSSTKKTVLKK